MSNEGGRRDSFLTGAFLLVMIPAHFLFMHLGPQIANQAGWFAAEMGRQPWIVYGLLRTSEGASKAVSAGQVWFSLAGFTVVYGLLGAVDIMLLIRYAKKGPEEAVQ